ncbi:MAG: hypothetical protein JSW61_07485 [Candidatus Thorarchaeota archaeon]|nr:MAG: hypothetical protein JSW61_07485 [Candidatus Thorarchaeota archaeon]
MPERLECLFCGYLHDLDLTECTNCGASLSDATRKIACDKCGSPLLEGAEKAGACVTCGKPVHLCEKHRRKVAEDEIYCKEHESECFIVTAVFGTTLDPRLDILRRFRDEWLSSNLLGRSAISIYYFLSPPIAKRTRGNETLRRILRATVVEPGLGFAEVMLAKEDES